MGLIKIKERGHKGLKTGALYELKQSGDDLLLIHHKTKKGRKVSFEFMRKLNHEYIPDSGLSM